MSEPTIIQAQDAYFTTTVPSGALSEADRLDGLSELSIPLTADTVDKNYMGSAEAGWKTSATTMRSFTGTITGHRLKDNAAQNRLETHFLSGLDGYLTVITDAEATAGGQGTRYRVKVTSFETGGAMTDVEPLKVSLTGQGAPVKV
ncbi:phage tail tube protein [Corallococcus silvisoli]|uniref:phage tail tube protein n=1 Tax=Corallococcus silvisoli TaxID=2697031 RepID=UPI0013766CE2|nr:phage tail tube protein [Corallococcus silvisoli]NBD09272.1 hypothetical protein [Corallococcus silvisoli]